MDFMAPWQNITLLAARLTKATALTAGVLLALSAHAQIAPVEEDAEKPSRYAIEIILFGYDDSVSAGTEVFAPDPPPVPEFGDSVDTPEDTVFGDATMTAGGADEADPTTAVDDAPDELMDGAAAEVPDIEFLPLPPEALAMSDIHERLTRLDAYEPVLWSGWSQYVLDVADTPSISLHRLGEIPADFDGELTLYVGRFVHLIVDVERTVEQPGAARPARQTFGRLFGGDANDFGQAPIIHYRIQEDRILRNGDLRYFDHPKLGLIARLELIEKTDEQPDVGDDSDALLPPGQDPSE